MRGRTHPSRWPPSGPFALCFPLFLSSSCFTWSLFFCTSSHSVKLYRLALKIATRKNARVHFQCGPLDTISYADQFLKLEIIRETGKQSGLQFSHQEESGGRRRRCTLQGWVFFDSEKPFVSGGRSQCAKGFHELGGVAEAVPVSPPGLSSRRVCRRQCGRPAQGHSASSRPAEPPGPEHPAGKSSSPGVPDQATNLRTI